MFFKRLLHTEKGSMATNAILIVFAACLSSVAEERGAWVACRTDDTSNALYVSWIGNGIILYKSYISSTVYAFDLKDGTWRQKTVPNNSLWRGKTAFHNEIATSLGYVMEPEEAAILWNDSIVLGYSGITHSFHTLSYDDTLLGSDKGYGCRGNTAWFLTNKKLYVFTADDTIWRSFEYNHPSEDRNSINITIFPARSYLLCDLWNAPTDNHTIIAFSIRTRQFAEYKGPAIHKNSNSGILEEGFTFYNRDVNDPERNFLACYSSYKGSIDTLRVYGQIYDVWNRTRTRNTSLFEAHLISNDGKTVTKTYYSFNQYKGTWNRYSFSFDPSTLEPICPMASGAGGSFTYSVAIGDSTNGVFNAFIYRAGEDSVLVIPTTLDNPLSNNTVGAIPGDSILILYNHSECTAIDIWRNRIAGLELPVQSSDIFTSFNGVSENGWGIYKFTEPGSDTVYYYSYNAGTNRFLQFKEYPLGGGEDILTNVSCGAFLNNTANRVNVYSPGNDVWRHFDCRSQGPVNLTLKPGFTSFYNGLKNEAVIVDGKTGEELVTTLLWPSNAYNYVYVSDSAVLVFQPDSTCRAYSAITHNINNFRHQYVLPEGKGAVVLLRKSYFTVAAFNARHDCMVPLELGSEEGAIASTVVTANTAFLRTSRGWIFGFDPEGKISSKNLNEYKPKLSIKNPSPLLSARFNTVGSVLNVKFLLSERGHAQIMLFDFSGKLIVKHELSDYAEGTLDIPITLSKGVYLCCLKESRSMKSYRLVVAN